MSVFTRGPRTYNLFISHAWDYHDEYYRLVEMLNSAPRFQWHNHSVPKHDPLGATTDAGLKRALHDQIRGTHIVIILAGMYAHYREWIQHEIDIAQGMGKPILGVRPWGQERAPQAVQDVAAEMVGWNSDSIVAAIRRNVL